MTTEATQPTTVSNVRNSHATFTMTVTIAAGTYDAEFWNPALQQPATKPITIAEPGATFRVYVWPAEDDAWSCGALPVVKGRAVQQHDDAGTKFLDRDEYPAAIEAAAIEVARRLTK